MWGLVSERLRWEKRQKEEKEMEGAPEPEVRKGQTAVQAAREF